MPVMPPGFQYTQIIKHHTNQATDIGFAAREPPLAAEDVTVTGGVTVVQGSAFALHGQETVAALFGFDDDFIVPNSGVPTIWWSFAD